MAANVYEIITDRIIKSLESGIVPWRVPWRNGAPKNLVSRKAYRGINCILLNATRFPGPWWMTYRQAESLGGQVIRGSKSTPIVFWKVFGDKEVNGKKERGGAILRYYSVFHSSQVEGLELPPEEENVLPFTPIEACARIVEGYRTCPLIEHGGNQACYIPSKDEIHMPTPEAFFSAESYYATLMHELVHSTGAKDRLNREGITNFDRFGSHQYSVEELIAECGSSFLMGEAGLLDASLESNVGYIQGWVRKLQSNPKWIIQASGQAAKAADYILGKGAKVEESEDEGT